MHGYFYKSRRAIAFGDYWKSLSFFGCYFHGNNENDLV